MRAGRRAPEVLLVSMPWAPRQYTPIRLGILQAALEQEELPCRTENLFLRFAERIGAEVYDRVASSTVASVGEWLFSASLGPARPDGFLEFVARGNAAQAEALGEQDPAALDGLSSRTDRRALARIRARDVPAFLSDELDRLGRRSYDIVGFSCSVNQLVPSLALARRWKMCHPEALIVLGGGSVLGPMGMECVRAFPWVDVVVDGEGEITLPELVRFHRQRPRESDRAGAAPAGLILRERGEVVRTPPRPPLADLDRVPIPDYRDYFAAARAMKRAAPRSILVQFETARGCWWGQRSNCLFCGINGTQLAYRAKSPGRVLLELLSLAGRYRASTLYAVDTICGKHFYEQVSPRLLEAGLDLTMFWEIHPSLARARLEALRDSGVRVIQPGIESFDTGLLRSMRKGTDALRNIRFLRWCRELGIDARYNLLWGTPGDAARAHDAMIALLPSLTHLAPPTYPPSRVVYQRFSPLTEEARAAGTALAPQQDYRFLYPPEVDLDQLAYVFEHPEPAPPGELRRVRALARQVRAWRDRYFRVDRPFLVFSEGPGFLEVFDTRGARARELCLMGPAASLVKFCADIRSRDAIQERIASEFEHAYSEQDVDEALAALVHDRLLCRDEDRYLSLAIPRRSLHEELAFASQTRREHRRVDAGARARSRARPPAGQRGT